MRSNQADQHRAHFKERFISFNSHGSVDARLRDQHIKDRQEASRSGTFPWARRSSRGRMSPWRGEHYFAVTKDVPSAEMVRLTGNFLAKVYEGPYRDAGKWMKDMQRQAEGKQLRKLYFFYTTCPKCAKHYGKNYVVAFAEI